MKVGDMFVKKLDRLNMSIGVCFICVLLILIILIVSYNILIYARDNLRKHNNDYYDYKGNDYKDNDYKGNDYVVDRFENIVVVGEVEKDRTKLYGSLFLDNLEEQIKRMTDPKIEFNDKRIDIVKYSDVLL